MGPFDRFRGDAQRVGAALASALAGSLEAPGTGGVTWHVRGERGGRAVRIELNELHGVFGVACTVRAVPVEHVRIHQQDSIFAGDNPYIAPTLKISTSYDEKALWALLPEPTRDVVADMLQPSSSSMHFHRGELSMLLGHFGVLRQGAAADIVLRELDRLLEVAPVIEVKWDVDPRTVGSGRSTYVRRPRPEPAPALPATPCDPANIAARARAARDAFLDGRAAQRIDLFPAASAMRERDLVRGKIVVLPPMPPSAWAADIPHKAVYAGEVENCWYFARTDDPGFSRVLRAATRYELSTGTKLGDAPYELIAEVTGNPMMVVVAKKAQIGHKLAVLGALIDGRVFVDATQILGADSLFEGEMGPRTN